MAEPMAFLMGLEGREGEDDPTVGPRDWQSGVMSSHTEYSEERAGETNLGVGSRQREEVTWDAKGLALSLTPEPRTPRCQ